MLGLGTSSALLNEETATETDVASVPPILATFATGLVVPFPLSAKIILSPTLKSLPPSKIITLSTDPEVTDLTFESTVIY